MSKNPNGFVVIETGTTSHRNPVVCRGPMNPVPTQILLGTLKSPGDSVVAMVGEPDQQNRVRFIMDDNGEIQCGDYAD